MPRLLIADDDPVHLKVLAKMLATTGLELEMHQNGEDAYRSLTENPPQLAILDWNMPGMDGLEICRRLRALPKKAPTYILMLTGREDTADLVAALEAGADDYVSKPAQRDELRARIMNGLRMIDLQLTLAHRVAELEEALAKVKALQQLLPICSYCKSVRNDDNYWQKVEAYFAEHADVRFSHGICPGCFESIVEPQLRALER
jgi:DNA-binding response OmpR family regulator